VTLIGRYQDRLAEFKAIIERFAARHLDAYVADLPTRPPAQAKEFNDPVWRTILADAHEVVVIDSPLFQRLQDIRQLGVAHLVYRSANHTRFEHSLGALHAMSVLIREVNATVTDPLRHDPEEAPLLPVPVTKDVAVRLRLAALLHDVGHGFMSHVSENAMRGASWLRDVEIAATEEIEDLYEGKKAAELATYYTVRSPSFRRLMEHLCSTYSDLSDPNGLVDDIGRASLGLPIRAESPFLTELLSGPFDVDKLDYISRDALFCGVPSVIDTARLIRKLRTTFANTRDLPDDIVERLPAGPDRVLVTGVARSGARTLDEFALARSLLTDKVYRHQKTRAYEALIGSIVAILSDLSTTPMTILWEFTDSDITSLPAKELIIRCGRTTFSQAQQRKIRLVAFLQQQYRNRSDFVTAYAWTTGKPDADVLDDDLHERGINMLREDVRRMSDRRVLEAQVGGAVTAIYSALGEDPPVVETPRDLRYLVRIDPVDEQSRNRGRAVLSRAFLIDRQANRIVKFSDDFSDTEDWTDLYLVNREASAIYAPRHLSSAVYLAAEEVFFRRYGVKTSRRMRQDCHVDWGAVDSVRVRLDSVGYYQGPMRALAPAPKVFDKAVGRNLVTAIVGRFSRYQGPGSESRSGAGDVTPERVREFVRQLPDPTLATAMLKVLSQVRCIDRKAFETAVRDGLNVLDVDPSKAVGCVLGDPDESSNAVTYLVRDAFLSKRIPLERIDNVGSLQPDTIVLVDDFVGKGTRSAGVLSSWLGVGTDARPLPAIGQEHLRAARIVLIFAAGLPGAKERITEMLTGTGLQPEVYVHDEDLPTIHTVGLRGEDRRLIALLTDIGKEVLARSKRFQQQQQVERALGFGNKGLLAVFPYSTPKQTVTALWASGEYQTGHWQALFPRAL
jgi:deoxynucleoside triphosphate triphosphohydrolase SAMHD1